MHLKKAAFQKPVTSNNPTKAWMWTVYPGASLISLGDLVN